MSLGDDSRLESQVGRLVTNVARLHAEIAESEPPHTMGERAELLLAINRHFGMRLLFTRWIMRILGCTQREVEAIRSLWYKEFTLDRVNEFWEKVKET